MKKFYWIIFFLLVVAALCAAQEIDDEAGKVEMSYSFGMVIASDLADSGLEFDYDFFLQGFRDVMEGEETFLTFEDALDLVNEAFYLIMVRQDEERRLEGEKNRSIGEAFLAENGQRPGIETTPSGLQYEPLSEGEGEKPGPADTVLVHYRGETIDGFVFDSSYERGEPLVVPLDRVIPGWAEGLRMTKEGGSARLFIPPDLAYGDNGLGGIAPGSVLVFDVELLAILSSPGGFPEED